MTDNRNPQTLREVVLLLAERVGQLSAHIAEQNGHIVQMAREIQELEDGALRQKSFNAGGLAMRKRDIAWLSAAIIVGVRIAEVLL